jgi:hypothetical protein
MSDTNTRLKSSGHGNKNNKHFENELEKTMKKTVLVVLFCFGSGLLMHLAHADEPGLGGEIVIGGGVVTGRLSQLDAEEGDSRVERRDERGDEETYLDLIINGELNYTLPNGRTTFFLTDLNTDKGLAAGVRQSLGDLGRISAAGTFETREVWQDPYLVGVARSRTDENSFGVSFGFEDILGTHFLFLSDIATVDVDEDRIGDRVKSLRRDGVRSSHGIGYAIGLDENQQLTPMVRYLRSDMEGDANSSDGYALTIGYEWGRGPWGIEASTGVGWTKYRKDHPVYHKERRATSFDASAIVAYEEPFGWSHVSLYGLAAYNLVNENIDFFDSSLWTFGLGLGYEF